LCGIDKNPEPGISEVLRTNLALILSLIFFKLLSTNIHQGRSRRNSGHLRFRAAGLSFCLSSLGAFAKLRQRFPEESKICHGNLPQNQLVSSGRGVEIIKSDRTMVKRYALPTTPNEGQKADPQSVLRLQWA
jgi:hypothetical protein